MIPLTFEKAKDFIEAMELHDAYDMTKADWDREGYMAILSRLRSPRDFAVVFFQLPMCQRLPFCLEACLLAGKEVEALMPRMAKAVFQDLIPAPRLMDQKPRQERIWARASQALKQGFREMPEAPEHPTHARAAGVAAYQAALIYCTPFIPLNEAHRAVSICLDAAASAQRESEGGSTILPKLLPLVQREYDAWRTARANLQPLAVMKRTSMTKPPEFR